MGLGQTPQLLGQRRIDREGVALATVARQRRPGEITGQLQHRMLVAQHRLPVLQLALLLSGLQPATLPQRVVAVLDRQRWKLGSLAALMGVVTANELIDQHVHRPAVGDNMVQGQQQYVALGVKLQHGHPPQGALLKIKRPQRLLLRMFTDGGVLLRRVQCTEVDAFYLQRLRRRHLQQAPVVLPGECGTQGLVPLTEADERFSQGLFIQAALQADRPRQVVGGALRLQLPEKPHALLRIGRQTALGCLNLGGNGKEREIDPFTGQCLQKDPALFRRQF
ncbi:hypothetical protein D3C81_952270 [compost metagenome]